MQPTSPNFQQHESQGSSTPKKRSGSPWRLIVLILVIVLLVLGAYFVKSQGWLQGKASTAPDRDLKQAVFLNNGQVYFGDLTPKDSSYVLTDVFYLQVNEPLQQQPVEGQTPAQQGEEPQINLIKLGSEIHGPTDKIVIPETSVIFWEDIKNDGTVGQAIIEFKNRQENGTLNQENQQGQQNLNQQNTPPAGQ